MKSLTLLGVMATLYLQLIAQNHFTKPLKIGDTLPAITINNVVNHSSDTIAIQSLSGKPLIIDFWGEFCTPCIKTLGKLDSLKHAYNNSFDVITVTDHSTREAVFKTLNRYPITSKLSLPVVLGSKQLKSWFPYKVISHLVWVGSDGVIKAITDGEAVTSAHIKQFIKGGVLHWPVKNDEVNFNLRQPLLEYTSAFTNPPQQLYYSGFFSYLAGVNPPSMFPVKDEVSGTQTISIFNEPLVNFCAFALDMPYVFGTDRFKLIVKDSSRFTRPVGIDKTQWNIQNLYCYTLRLPMNINAAQRTQIMREDIKNWLFRLGIQVEKDEDKIIITEH